MYWFSASGVHTSDASILPAGSGFALTRLQQGCRRREPGPPAPARWRVGGVRPPEPPHFVAKGPTLAKRSKLAFLADSIICLWHAQCVHHGGITRRERAAIPRT